ncbi:DUF4230 domain-containing protein [Streptococcus sp. sy018]|uniref:DUF4230 domain-containing protein n=1 Tax=Streptococcus sp. sy018 TaxID=2600147 RepID=UPI0011B4AB7E|nr:DUF4230 domain-containing protein [Streptococcus sp. sy018]TWS95460.1 DUF4230 domain-containing protein [Streptococcus sp. sy018]
MLRKAMVCLFILVALLIGGFFTLNYTGVIGTTSNNSSSSVVQYIEKVKETVFLNVGVQRIETQKNNVKLFSKFNLPLTEKKTIIILNYQAKLGIKKSVSIRQTSDNRYQITVPKFEVIGVEQAKVDPYKLYDSSGELLSVFTQNVDTGELATKALSNKEQKEYLEKYQEQLQIAAKDYYRTLFKSINPGIELDFVFK